MTTTQRNAFACACAVCALAVASFLHRAPFVGGLQQRRLHASRFARSSPRTRPAFGIVVPADGFRERSALLASEIGEDMGLNELQTRFRSAVQRQDFDQAEALSNELVRRLSGKDLSSDPAEKRMWRRRMSWKGLGTSPWLVDRLDSLNYTFPTTIQICAMESVNTLIEGSDGSNGNGNGNVDSREDSSMQERLANNDDDIGVIISGATGSGKTLAYLVPMLSTLSESLFTRQRLRVSSEETVGDTTGDLLDRIAVVTSPAVRTNSRRQVRSNVIATGASLATLGKSGKDVRYPLALVLVPTRELGVQVAMLLYELVGGNIKNSPDEIKGKANMFKFKGPKGVRIGCVLDDEEAEFGLKLQTDIAITTPAYINKLVQDEDILPSMIRVVAIDEADLVLEQLQELSDLTSILDGEREFNRLTLFAGASVTQAIGRAAVQSNILPPSKTWIATATRYTKLEHDQGQDSNDTVNDDGGQQTADKNRKDSTSSQPLASDLSSCLDPSLSHELVTVEDNTGLLVLARLLRQELEQYSRNNGSDSNGSTKKPRVVVFFPTEEMAKKAISPLRDALWGQHKVGVLLPTIGVNPLTIMDQFKKSQLSVLLATPTSVRGLDFDDLTHVYTLYLPMDDPREYIHLAGRVGRVGQLGSNQGGGKVVSVLPRAEAEKMRAFASQLSFDVRDIPPPKPPSVALVDDDDDDDVETDEDFSVDASTRQYLEDTMNLLQWQDSANSDSD